MKARMVKVAATLACVAVALAIDLQAQTRYEAVHTFSGDRGRPLAALTEAPDAKLYGTTVAGGFHGKGSVFVTDGAGNTTVLHEFNGNDGEAPQGRLLVGPDGLLYGTTSRSAGGFGTIFRLMRDGSAFEMLVEFTGPNGLIPQAGLVQGSDGALYGTTVAGGQTPVGAGTIFRLTPDGAFSTLVSFNGVNGALPSGELIATADGLYGTTSEGGSGFGTVFRADLDGTLTTLLSFDGLAASGVNPAGGVILASDGNLYGTTLSGGASGLGTLFRIPATGCQLLNQGCVETLHSFSGADGAVPTGALRELIDGHVYGTTSRGGTAESGTIFRISLDGTFTTIASFAVDAGSFPASGVIQTTSGAVYGTTEAGGPGFYGTVFELMPDAAIRTAVAFTGAVVADPAGGLTQASDGHFYGIAISGGADGFGAVFRMTSDGVVTILASFDRDAGLFPTGALVQASDGHLYGTTEGGITGDGGVFRVTLDGTLTTIGLFDFVVNGAAPSGRLVEGSDGHLYGTTLFGANGAPGGVFRVNRADGIISAVATFAVDESHGLFPASGLVEAPDGSFYGTATMGGANGLGTLFRVVPGGELSTVVSFNGADGSFPASPLLLGKDGNLYGTTAEGGSSGFGTLFRLTLGGTHTLTTLVSFDGIDGWYPYQQGVIETAAGVFSGTTMLGGEQAFGTAYQWSDATGLVIVHRFDGVSGDGPNATLMKAADGALYGTTIGPRGGVVYRLVPDKAQASLLLAPASAIYGGTTTVTATLSVAGTPISGAAIGFSLNGALVGSALTDAAGLATLADVSIAGLAAGSYPGAVMASFAGTDTVQAAAAAGDLMIARATPTIAVETATFIYDGQPHPATGAVTGVGGEALGPLTFTYNGSAAPPVDPGAYTVVASFAGNTSYDSANATVIVTILPAPAGLHGLVAAYGFNEGSGSVAGDASGRGHGGVIKQAQWAGSGRFGGALDFDGVNDLVTIQDAAALDIRTAITIEAWVRPRTLHGWNTIVLKQGDNRLAYALYANDSSPRPAGYVRIAGADKAVIGLEALELNTWTHVTTTYDGTAMQLFINGVEVGRRSLTGGIEATNGPLQIGGNRVWGEYFNGLIDEVRIYDRALSASEIQRDMNMPVAYEGIAPSVAIDSPRHGAVLSGIPTVTVTASDNFGLSSVQLQVDGADAGAALVTAPFSFRLDAANGTYGLRAVARDVAGNMTVSDLITITIDNAPVAAYDFNEESGSLVVDASGHNNSGSMSGGVSRTIDATRGRVLSFNGSDGLVSVADSASLDLRTGMTLEAWVRPTALEGWRTVIMKEGDGLSYAIYANDNAPWPAGYVRINDLDRPVRGGQPLPLSTWTHLAMTYDGAMLRLFVNGVEVRSRPQTGSAEMSDRELRIGGNTVWGEWFEGQIDEVRIYDVAIATAQIKADMNR